MANQRSSVIPDNLVDLVEAKAFPVVATVGPHGEPQANPVWITWDGEYIRFSQTTHHQKYHNLQRNNRIAMTFVDPENPYRYLEVRGTVAAIDEDTDLTFLNSLAQRYMNVETYPYHQEGDQRVIVVIKPEHTTTMS
jgi:PPOX class probable F420-dependent enzyme